MDSVSNTSCLAKIISEETFLVREIPEEELTFGNYLAASNLHLKAVFLESEKHRLIEEYGIDSYSVIEDGKLLLERDFARYENMRQWIFSFGDKVRILEPKSKSEVSVMTESRCGLLCSECSYREQMNCKGCVHIEKPFWGESCPIKSCCESKKHAHCGQCKDFPCALLNQFAYDEKQGDNGKRIEQCKINSVCQPI